jgi:hypothetical protein
MVEIEQKRYADDITLQELVRLRVEIERLREALLNIAKTADWPTQLTIAKDALQQKGSE